MPDRGRFDLKHMLGWTYGWIYDFSFGGWSRMATERLWNRSPGLISHFCTGAVGKGPGTNVGRKTAPKPTSIQIYILASLSSPTQPSYAQLTRPEMGPRPGCLALGPESGMKCIRGETSRPCVGALGALTPGAASGRDVPAPAKTRAPLGAPAVRLQNKQVPN